MTKRSKQHLTHIHFSQQRKYVANQENLREKNTQLHVWGNQETLKQTCCQEKTSTAPFAFSSLMIHWILQFTLRIAVRCVLHRCTSQDIHRWKFKGIYNWYGLIAWQTGNYPWEISRILEIPRRTKTECTLAIKPKKKNAQNKEAESAPYFMRFYIWYVFGRIEFPNEYQEWFGQPEGWR